MIFAASQRLILRRPRGEDLEALVTGWSDPDMTRHTGQKPDVRGFLADMIADMQSKLPGDSEPGGPWFQFIVERREDQVAIGDIGVGFGVPGERQAELGYRILPQFQRRGYGREALAAAIDYLIAEHRIHRLVAVAAAPNLASAGLLASLGFRKEGRFRESFLCQGEWIDDDYFALLARDWRG